MTCTLLGDAAVSLLVTVSLRAFPPFQMLGAKVCRWCRMAVLVWKGVYESGLVVADRVCLHSSIGWYYAFTAPHIWGLLAV